MKTQTKKHILHYLKKYFTWIIITLILLILCIFINFSYPLFLTYIINCIDENQNINLLSQFSLLFLLLVVQSLTSFIMQKTKLYFSKHFFITEYKNLYKKFFNTLFEKVKKDDPTYFITRFDTYLSNIFLLLSTSISEGSLSLITIIVALFLITAIDFKIVFIIFWSIPIYYYSYKYINKKLQEYSKELQNQASMTYSNIIGIVQNIETIKQLNGSEYYSNKVQKNVISLQNLQYEINSFAAKYTTLSDFVVELINNISLFYLIYLFFIGQTNISSVFLFYQLRNILGNEIKKLTRTNLNLRDLRPAIDFIEKNIDDFQEVNSTLNIEAIDKISIKVSDFGFSNNKNVLHDIYFDIMNGEHVGIIAESGKGKSTLVRLISRYYENNQVLINNIPINEFSYESIRKKIYLMTQNVELFPGTILENITVNHDFDKVKDEINSLLKLDCFSSIANLPDGINTLIKENASNLSGGQKQLVALLRMIVQNPEVIIFDESFSSIDENTEEKIFNNLSDFLSNKTIITIAHRNSTIEYCDKLIKI